MVQKKIHKSKPKSRQALFKPKDDKELNVQLEAFGLRIIQVTADGNCLFRAVAEQLEGNEEEHLKYREMVVDHIQAHRDEYEPFLEDDVAFNDYCKNMRETSTWAGHMELQVISLVTRTNICIHQLLSPRWHIQNFESTKVHCMHLSYHNGEHYNSIRRKDDSGGGKAKPILLEAPEMKHKKVDKGGVSQKRQITCNKPFNKARSTAATEEETSDEVALTSADDDAHNIDNQGELEQVSVETLKLSGSEKEEDVHTEDGASTSTKRLSQQMQKIARNKACPCGSRKKYKVCCGALTPRHKFKETMRSTTEGLSNKARKQKLRIAKSMIQGSKPVINEELPDMGFLCI